MGILKIVYLSLGSNLGDRARQIARAVEALAGAGVRPLRESSLYLTEPVGGPDQRAFLNGVLEAETRWMPRELLRHLQQVEWSLGRRRMVSQGPRAIDIDILFYGASVVRSRELTIPHPRIAERRFVLVPLSEIAPTLRHPVLHQTAAELLAASGDRSMVRRWSGSGHDAV
ncbi:MAG TPA: 2-amino-4-hydroxy-6-hydroxymethyldihydropteridine diphosphokinase [Candidatus Dormibacteraeota bacterium]|nr:2-amino-4-hydroxy-6-hydroxymethyldihydropteridine diphosphokinase [Candidatus Dormibacteraeota bacterium]